MEEELLLIGALEVGGVEEEDGVKAEEEEDGEVAADVASVLWLEVELEDESVEPAEAVLSKVLATITVRTLAAEADDTDAKLRLNWAAASF